MGKSRESFSKKETEKKRLKKKQDKVQKKEDRKTHSVKAQDLTEMFAYVDENGNLSSTPPNPEKKRVVTEESISVSVSRRVDEPEEIDRKGTVTFFNESKGYGFIQDEQNRQSIFVHINSVLTPIKENDKVSFQVEKREKGPTAVQVKKI